MEIFETEKNVTNFVEARQNSASFVCLRCFNEQIRVKRRNAVRCMRADNREMRHINSLLAELIGLLDYRHSSPVRNSLC